MSGFKVFSTGKDLDAIFNTRTGTDPSAQVVPYFTPTTTGEIIAAWDTSNVFFGSGTSGVCVFKSNGVSSWSSFGGGVSNLVYAIVPTGPNSAYVGGDFGPGAGVGNPRTKSFGVAYYG